MSSSDEEEYWSSSDEEDLRDRPRRMSVGAAPRRAARAAAIKFIDRRVDFGVGSFRVSLVPGRGHPNARRLKPRNIPRLTPSEFKRRLASMLLANTEGYDVFCRPNDNTWVLVDDVDEESPCVQHGQISIETSAGNYQVWCRVPACDTDDDYRAVSKHLQVMYDADPGAARVGQVGRLPSSFIRNTADSARLFIRWSLFDGG